MTDVVKQGLLSKALGFVRGLVPVIIKFVPPLAGWASVIYVAFDLVLWVIKHFGL